MKLEGRSIPGSAKFIFTGAAHHSITGGSLLRLDRTRGTEELDPLTLLTPEVPFPETEGWGDTYYANPLPLSEDYYLVGWSNRKLPPHGFYPDVKENPINAMGLYLYDAFGNLTPLYRDPAISCSNPIPVRPRPKPPVYADSYAWDQVQDQQEGTFLLKDVYQGFDGHCARNGEAVARHWGVHQDPAADEHPDAGRLVRRAWKILDGDGAGGNGRVGLLPRSQWHPGFFFRRSIRKGWPSRRCAA